MQNSHKATTEACSPLAGGAKKEISIMTIIWSLALKILYNIYQQYISAKNSATCINTKPVFTIAIFSFSYNKLRTCRSLELKQKNLGFDEVVNNLQTII